MGEKLRSIAVVGFACFGLAPLLLSQNLGGWQEPDGGWDYVYEAFAGEDIDGEFDFSLGGSLDGTWTHNNASDAWDGSGPGDEFRPDGFTPAAPGGAGIVIVPGAGEDGGDAEVLSIVDTGDPRSRGFPDPSNRKLWFCHDVARDLDKGGNPINADFSLRDGLTLIVRSRLHPDIDPDTPGWQIPDGGIDNDAGQGAAPGYTLRDGGKGGHGFWDRGVARNFSFTPFGTTGYQFPPQVAEGLPPANFLDVGDNTVFHAFWVTIIAGSMPDRYDVTVYIDGSNEPAKEFRDMNLNPSATDCGGINHLHMGFHSTPQVGAMQVDYFGYKVGLHEPSSVCPGGLAASFDAASGNVSLSWSAGAGDSYTLRRNGVVLQEGISRSTTAFTDTNPVRPSSTYELVQIRGGVADSRCQARSVSIRTIVCPQLSCTADRIAGTVTLDWTAPGFFTPRPYRILRNGAEVGTAPADATSFVDRPPPGEYLYELGIAGAGDDTRLCLGAACEARLFGRGSIEIRGDVWDQVIVNGVARIAATSDGVKSLYFPAGQKSLGDTATFGVDVRSLGGGEIGGERFRVELRARFESQVRLVNLTAGSYVHFALSRTGVSTATDELGNQEPVEQVPGPPGGAEVDSASSTIVNTDSIGILLEPGLNLMEVRAVNGPFDPEGMPHAAQVQLLALRIGAFSDLDASLASFPCPSGFTCVRQADGKVVLDWRSEQPHAYELHRDGTRIASLPLGNTTSFTDEPGNGAFTYVLRATDDPSCPESTCTIAGGVPRPDGAIADWLVLGPLDWGCVSTGLASCANPGVEAIRRDHLAGTSGGQPVDQATIEPVEGMEIVLGPQATVRATARNDINPGRPGIAKWFYYNSRQSVIDYNVVFGGDPGNDFMAYAVTYVDNTSGSDRLVDLAVTSDDSVEVYINDVSVHVNNVARPVGAFDFVPGITLEAGINRVLVKVFEGGGGTGFSLRFEEQGLPVTGDLEIVLSPSQAPVGPRFVRGDVDSDGTITITDAIKSLSFQFTGGARPECMDAADADDSGSLTITDAVRILSWLFTSGAAPPPPAPTAAIYPAGDCGIDPTEDLLDCAITAQKCR
jgi:hypothetical protein